MKRQRKGKPERTFNPDVRAAYVFGKLDPQGNGQIIVDLDGQRVTRHAVGGRVNRGDNEVVEVSREQS